MRGFTLPTALLMGAFTATWIALQVAHGSSRVLVGTGSETGTAYDGTVAALRQLRLLIVVAAAALGLVWMYRVAVNARTLTSGAPGTPSPGWTIGAWFIPVANLYLVPWNLIRIWKRSGAGPPLPVYTWATLAVAATAVGTLTNFALHADAQDTQLGKGMTAEVDFPGWLLGLQWLTVVTWSAAGACFAWVMHRLAAAQHARQEAARPSIAMPT